MPGIAAFAAAAAPRRAAAPPRRAACPARWTAVAPGRRTGFARFVRGDGPDAGAEAAAAARLPSPETACACGAGPSYAECCRRFHTDAATPPVALDLLRARYAAYAYRLPAYVMRTTHGSTAERDRNKWKKEILEFAAEYRFVDGVECIDQNMTSADSTTILFRAKMRRRTTPVSFMELGKFVREGGTWFYVDGKLVDVDDSS